MASAYSRHGADRSSGIPPTRKAQDAAGRTGSNSAQRSSTSSQGTGPVELPDHGSAQRAISFGGAADLGGQRPQTAPHSNFQALQRSPVRGEILGCHRVVSGSSDPRDRPLLRREEPMPGLGANPTRTSLRPRPPGHSHSRLLPAWDGDSVCCVELPERKDPR